MSTLLRRACALLIAIAYFVPFVFLLQQPVPGLMVGMVALLFLVVPAVIMLWFPGRFPAIREFLNVFIHPLFVRSDENDTDEEADLRRGRNMLLGPIVFLGGSILWYIIYYLIVGHAQ